MRIAQLENCPFVCNMEGSVSHNEQQHKQTSALR